MSDLIERLRNAGADYIGACYPDGSPDQAKLLDVGYEHGGLHHVAADEIERLRRELAEAHGSGEKLREAILWALGERDTFPDEPEPLAGKYRRRYWWRTELRRRAFGTAPDQPTAAVCHWKQDAEGSEWDTDCGLSWYFEDAGPTENGAKFCCGCGKPLVAVPYVDPPTCDECGEELLDGACPDCTTADNPADQPSAARAFTPMDRERLQRKIQGDPDDGDVSAGQFLPHKFDGHDEQFMCEQCGRESDHPIHTVNPADQPNAVKPCADCGEPTDVWHDGTHLCWKCRA